jgi:hypothetical protein
MKLLLSPPWLVRPVTEPLTPLGGQKGASGVFWAVPRVESPVGQVGLKKAAAHGRSALALLRTPSRGLCLDRWPYSGPSRTRQMRRPATCSERSLRTVFAQRLCLPRRAPLAGSDDADAHAALRSDDAVASRRAADGTVPSIEAARTYAHGTSRGAVAVSRAFFFLPATLVPSSHFGLAHLKSPESCRRKEQGDERAKIKLPKFSPRRPFRR